MDSRPHILVVDDDSEIRSLLAQYLEKNEYRTTTVADGAAMKKVLSRNRPDLVVLDIMMPGQDGLTLCRDLRATSALPVIMLTARGDAVDRIIGLELGRMTMYPSPSILASSWSGSETSCEDINTRPLTPCHTRFANTVSPAGGFKPQPVVSSIQRVCSCH